MTDYRIKLDIRKSVSANAEMYYEAAKKAREKLEGVEKALTETENRIKKLEEKQAAEVEKLKTPVIKKKRGKKWFEKYHFFVSSDGFLVVGGRDATTNEILIKKNTDAGDLVFHADIHGAPFFVIKNPERKEIPEKTIKEAAEAAAIYSSAWKHGVGSVDVYYVLPEQVSKTAPSGEYLGKGGFMIAGKKNYVRGVKMEFAVGVVCGEEVSVVSGPVSSVESKTPFFIKLFPGERRSAELAKEIKERLAGMAGKEYSERIRKLDVELLQHVIPAGRGSLKP